MCEAEVLLLRQSVLNGIICNHYSTVYSVCGMQNIVTRCTYPDISPSENRGRRPEMRCDFYAPGENAASQCARQVVCPGYL